MRWLRLGRLRFGGNKSASREPSAHVVTTRSRFFRRAGKLECYSRSVNTCSLHEPQQGQRDLNGNRVGERASLAAPSTSSFSRMEPGSLPNVPSHWSHKGYRLRTNSGQRVPQPCCSERRQSDCLQSPGPADTDRSNPQHSDRAKGENNFA